MSGLEARPGAITLGLDELVDLAWKGRIRVPDIWNEEWAYAVRRFDRADDREPIHYLQWRRPPEELVADLYRSDDFRLT
jgi:hypothetical protein